MGKPTPKARREDREKAARVAEQLAALTSMTTADLAAKFEALTSRAPRSRNRQWLRKRVAWHLQAAAFGGLSEAALAKIEELTPLALKMFGPGARGRAKAALASRNEPAGPKRDPRLPAPGTVLKRSYGNRVIEVTVVEDGFVMDGTRYRSLSKIARQITGTAWNGFAFFALASGREGRKAAAA